MVFRFGFAVAVMLALSCAGARPAAAELKVVVTIKPIHSLVTQLMEGIGEPTLLVDGAASPHTFSLKPSGVRAIDAADVFIRVSQTLEPFTAKIAAALPESVRLVTLEDAPGIKLLSLRTAGTFEPHRHGVEANADAAEQAPGAKDGHIWLDPDNAKVIVNYLARALSERAPADAARIKVNADKLNAKIDALTAEIATETKPVQDRPFVVFHDAYQYFADRFDLDSVGSITVSPEMQPSAKRLSELRGKIRSLHAVCLFAEPLFQPNLVAAVIEGTDVRTSTLDPEGVLLPAGAELYFQLMRNLAAGFRSCLGTAS
jgi:zinc transport system substrate-binding protein